MYSKYVSLKPEMEVWVLKEKRFVRANDIVEDLDVSIPFAYKIIRELNAELRAKGYMTVAGRVSKQFYEEKFYGVAQEEK